MKALRSLLFVPSSNPDLVTKAFGSGADAVILDLEDAVPASSKSEARAYVAQVQLAPGPEVLVRVNDSATQWIYDDLVAAVRPGVAGIVVPKAESAVEMVRLDGAVAALESARGLPVGGIALVPLIESALGVQDAFSILSATPRVQAVLFGSGEHGDLVADLGCTWTPEGTGLLHARSGVLLAARAAGVQEPLDAVFMNFRDTSAMRRECLLAQTIGYVGKAAIHPGQVAVIHDVFTPADALVQEQSRILAAFEEAERQGSASIQVDGRMVDYAVARTARRIVERARRSTSTPDAAL